MKIENKLCTLIKNMDGNVIGIGSLPSSVLNKIDKNKKIVNCILLSDITKKQGKGKKGKGKTIRIQKLRKYFKKHTIQYFVCEIDVLEKYKKYFIKDSIYLLDKNIYLYTKDKTEDISVWIERYKRYNTSIEIDTLEDGILISIVTKEHKRNYIKNKWYFLIDSLNEFLDIVGELLIS